MRRRSTDEPTGGGEVETAASPSRSHSRGSNPSTARGEGAESRASTHGNNHMFPPIIIEPESSGGSTQSGTPAPQHTGARASFMVPPAITAPRLQAFAVPNASLLQSCAGDRRKDVVRRESEFRDLTASPLLDVQLRVAPPARRLLETLDVPVPQRAQARHCGAGRRTSCLRSSGKTSCWTSRRTH